MALAALALVVFGAYDSFPSGRGGDIANFFAAIAQDFSKTYVPKIWLSFK